MSINVQQPTATEVELPAVLMAVAHHSGRRTAATRIADAIAEALKHWRWNDPAAIARDNFTVDHPSHPSHRRCVGCREPLAGHAGKPMVSHGWVYGSRECYRATARYCAADDAASRTGAAR